MTNLYNNIKTKIKNFIFGFYAQKIHIDFLERISENQKDEQTKFANNYGLVLKDRLKNDFGYTDNELDTAKRYLLGASYISQSRGQLGATQRWGVIFS